MVGPAWPCCRVHSKISAGNPIGVKVENIFYVMNMCWHRACMALLQQVHGRVPTGKPACRVASGNFAVHLLQQGHAGPIVPKQPIQR